MKITNTGKVPDRLVGGTLDHARRFEVHEMTMVDNVMRMRPLSVGLEVRPGETVELKPGSYHIMGVDLDGGYKKGQHFTRSASCSLHRRDEKSQLHPPVRSACP
jgi:copper(I)-binding protein